MADECGFYKVKLYVIFQCLSEDYEGIDDGRHYTLSYDYTERVVLEELKDGSLDIRLYRNVLPIAVRCKYPKPGYTTNSSVVKHILEKCAKYGIECEYKLLN